MRPVIRFVSLGTIIEAVLALAVVLFACGSSSLADATRIGHSTRWVALLAVCGMGLLVAWRAWRRSEASWAAFRFAWLPGVFLALAVLSAAWSPRPRLTIERAFSLGALFVAGTALAIAARADPNLRRRVLTGLAIGASTVGFAGVLMAIAGMPESQQPGGGVNPWRFQGFGQNPNTVAVLAAVALPIITWLALTSPSARARFGWGVSFLVLLGTTVASQSRGGLIGAFLGVAVVLGLLVDEWPRKVGAIAALALVIGGGVTFREYATQAPPPFVSSVQAGPTTPGHSSTGGKGGGKGKPKPPPTIHAGALPARSDEIGHPGLSTHDVTTIGSGRVAAWLGALKLVRDRPLLGYGFGTEEIAFVDRWYFFQGARTENSVIGILLELGVIGLLPLVAFLVLLVRTGVRALRSENDVVRREAVAPLGVCAAAVALVGFQSYIYSVGNVATMTVWIALFLLSAGVAREEDGALSR